jgi:pyrimidine-specific ribonucleoside hydrolase
VIIGPGKTKLPLLDDLFWQKVESVPSRYARQLATIHQEEKVMNTLYTGRTRVWDELTALYLIQPSLFGYYDEYNFMGEQALCIIKPDSLAEVYLFSLREKVPAYKVFRSLPLEVNYFQDDVASSMDSIINSHGVAEWFAGILTNELHGHLGIYSIMGMKMGIRAREYFNIGLDDLYIHSYAGRKPPVSCMNDGLQVSTGATLGHGLIHAEAAEIPQPEADFIFKNSKIRIQLKDEYASIIRLDVSKAIKECGTDTDEYWAHIRELAIRYWLDFDRHEIFNVLNAN